MIQITVWYWCRWSTDRWKQWTPVTWAGWREMSAARNSRQRLMPDSNPTVSTACPQISPNQPAAQSNPEAHSNTFSCECCFRMSSKILIMNNDTNNDVSVFFNQFGEVKETSSWNTITWTAFSADASHKINLTQEHNIFTNTSSAVHNAQKLELLAR